MPPMSFVSYFKRRFTIWPWFILPILLALISHSNSWGLLELISLNFLALLFFRILDDFKCAPFDEKFKGRAFRMKSTGMVLSILGSVWMLALYVMGGWSPVLLGSTAVASSMLFYSYLEAKIDYVSILKYPFLVYLPHADQSFNPLIAGVGVAAAALVLIYDLFFSRGSLKNGSY